MASMRFKDIEFPEKKYSNIYRAYLADTWRRLDELPPKTKDRLTVLPCLEYLMVSQMTFLQVIECMYV